MERILFPKLSPFRIWFPVQKTPRPNLDLCSEGYNIFAKAVHLLIIQLVRETWHWNRNLQLPVCLSSDWWFLLFLFNFVSLCFHLSVWLNCCSAFCPPCTKTNPSHKMTSLCKEDFLPPKNMKENIKKFSVLTLKPLWPCVRLWWPLVSEQKLHASVCCTHVCLCVQGSGHSRAVPQTPLASSVLRASGNPAGGGDPTSGGPGIRLHHQQLHQ